MRRVARGESMACVVIRGRNTRHIGDAEFGEGSWVEIGLWRVEMAQSVTVDVALMALIPTCGNIAAESNQKLIDSSKVLRGNVRAKCVEVNWLMFVRALGVNNAG
jgi:hypothetical protein